MIAWSVCLILNCLVLPMDDPASAKAQESTKIPFGGTDFKQYYTASRLIVEGLSPYNIHRAEVLQRALGNQGPAQLPYGPPTTLLPFIPMGWFDFTTSIQIQFVLNVSLLVISCFLWGGMLFPRQALMPVISCVVAVLWLPSMSLCGMGQVTTWTLFGFTLWCALMLKNKPGLAGCGLALSIIKPHLAFGLVIYAFVLGLRQRQWKMLLGFVGTVGLMILATLLIRPSSWLEYLNSLKEANPIQWYNSTLDGWGRYVLGEWFRAISIAISTGLLAWIILLAYRSRKETSVTEMAIQAVLALTLWMTASPYAFSYDFVLLLPAFILAVGSLLYEKYPNRLLVFSGWMILDAVYVLMKGPCYEYHYFFIPCSGLVLLLILLEPRRKQQ